jgi:hypothetical protein
MQTAKTAMSDTEQRRTGGDANELAISNHHTGVMDVESAPPPPRPIDDILLMDMSWSGLTAPFPPDRVHADVREGETPLFAVNDGLRVLALLPVKRILCRDITTAKWVPFLVDTGAPSTHFTQATVDALKLNTADRILVMEEPITFRTSTNHFIDINVLGTDVLKCARVLIDYPTKVVDIQRTVVIPPIARDVWVRVGDNVMRITSSENDIFALKKAVQAELTLSGEGPIHIGKMHVKKHDGTACRGDSALEANTYDTAYIVTRESPWGLVGTGLSVLSFCAIFSVFFRFAGKVHE